MAFGWGPPGALRRTFSRTMTVLLTGVAAGTPDAAGTYAADTVHGRVQQRLEGMAADLSRFSGLRTHAQPEITGNGVRMPPVGIN